MKLLVIKLLSNADKNMEYIIENAFKLNEHFYYNTVGKNKEEAIKLFADPTLKNELLDTIIIIHKSNTPIKAYLCKAKYLEPKSNFLCKDLILVESTDSNIDNFLREISLNLESDFNPKTYISIKDISEKSYFNFINKVHPPYIPNGKTIKQQKEVYEPIETENNLHELAQRNEYCIRPLGIQSVDKNRGEFQRDRERIVHTKSYRRLVDKAQIFTSNKGDHYRTRMTHTLEVSQIARGISQKLNLNLDLTEAIALGHDIGHTPFGHQGERTLNDILEGNIDIIPNAKDLKIGGFNHNYQALRVLSYLEEKYIEHEGIDLSYQTLEGILKHTKCKLNTSIDSFLIYGDAKYLFLQDSTLNDKNHFSVTLEGQVVEIADEIAQRGHDLDDAFAAGLLNFNEFRDACSIVAMNEIKEIVDVIKSKIDSYKNRNRMIIDETDMIRAMLVPKILGYLISDVINHSNKNISNYDYSFFNTHKVVDKKLITFSDDGLFIIQHLNNLIFKNVINTFEVSRFDSKAEFIISSLFKAYYKNPKILPDSVLLRFKKELSKITINPIDIRFDDSKYIEKELKKITQITQEQIDSTECAVEYKAKRRILARCIADHISGMTDNYALNEFSKLYEGSSGHI